MSMGPKVKRVRQRSQATPLAEDLLARIQGQLDQGTFGQGFGGLDSEAGTAIRQFMARGGANLPAIRDVSGPGVNFGEMIDALETVQNRNVNRNAADLREQFGAAGTRYGTTAQQGEGRFRAEAAQDWNVQLGQLAMALDNMRRADETLGVNRDVAAANFALQGGNQELQSIMQMFSMGQANLAPLFQLAAMGILPDEIIAQPGAGAQIMAALPNFLSATLPTIGRAAGWGQSSVPGVPGQSMVYDPNIGRMPDFTQGPVMPWG